MEVIFWNIKLIFTEKIFTFIRQNTIHMVKGILKAYELCIINAFDHMEFCLVLNLTSGKPAVTWPPKIATRYVSFATALNTR